MDALSIALWTLSDARSGEKLERVGFVAVHGSGVLRPLGALRHC